MDLTKECAHTAFVQRGNDAQACVRIDAAEELTSQLADVADEAMRLERRCEALSHKQVVMSSLCAKVSGCK